MHRLALAEGMRLSDKAGQPLPQRVVPALDIVGLVADFTERLMLPWGMAFW